MTVPDPGAPPGRATERLRMSVEMAFDLVVCGVLFAGLSLLARHVEPDLPRVTLLTGLVGGGLCVVWGVLGRHIAPCRWGAMVTFVAVAGVFVRQALQSWGVAHGGEPRGGMVVALMGPMVVFCVGMLVNLAQEGKARKP